MAPADWASKRKRTSLSLSQLLKITNFMKERRGQVTEVDILKTFSVRHNVAEHVVEQHLEMLRTRQVIKTEFQFVSVQVHILNRIFF